MTISNIGTKGLFSKSYLLTPSLSVVFAPRVLGWEWSDISQFSLLFILAEKFGQRMCSKGSFWKDALEGMVWKGLNYILQNVT